MTMRSFLYRAFLFLAAAVVIGIVAALLSVPSRTANAATFSPYVDENGAISVPENFRSWSFLGTWAVTKGEKVLEFHNVYTQPSTIEAYRKTGKFPDGAVLVKELLHAEAGRMTTGQVSWAGKARGWFVLIKDTKGRFKSNKLWGDGWGWALFEVTPDNPQKLVTEDYKIDCIPCHNPARATDWIYIQGYPSLIEKY